MVDFLMDNEYQRADASQKDSLGNTVLHALVMVADNSRENTEFITSMYDRILVVAARLKPKVRLEGTENNQGLTPFKMAAKTGKIGVSTRQPPKENHGVRRFKHLLIRKHSFIMSLFPSFFLSYTSCDVRLKS